MKCILNLIVPLFFVNALSQDIYVKDNLTNEVIPGVVFYQKNNSNIVLNQKSSDFDGKISLNGFIKNELIFITHISYIDSSVLYNNDFKTNIFLNPDLNSLDEIVISASKFSQNLK